MCRTPTVLPALLKPPKEREGWPPPHRGHPRPPRQGSAPPHYLLLQSRLHPSTPNRDYRPSTVSNCPDSDQAGPSPPPHTPGCPTSVPLGAGRLPASLAAGDTGTRMGEPPGGHGPHRAADGKLVSGGSHLGAPSACLCPSCFRLSASAVSASLRLRLGLRFPAPTPASTPGCSHQITRPQQLPSPSPRGSPLLAPCPLPPLPPPPRRDLPGEGWGGAPKAESFTGS